MKTNKNESPNIILDLSSQKYVISSDHIQKMISVDKIQQTANPLQYHMGVLVHGDEIYQCIDLRSFLGLITVAEENRELAALLSEREADHIAWVNELKSCLEEKRDFTLSRNPNECKFGKWHKTFKTINTSLAQQLALLDAPHKRLHAFADEVLAIASQDHEKSLAVMMDFRDTTLSHLLRIFDGAKKLLTSDYHKVGVIIHGEKQYCLIVDNISAVRKLHVDKEEQYSSNPYVSGTIKELKTNEILQRLNLLKILDVLDSEYKTYEHSRQTHLADAS